MEEENTFLGCTVHLSNTEAVVGVSATDARLKAAANGTEVTLGSAGEVTVELETGWLLMSVTGTTAEGRMELVVTAALLTTLMLDLFNKITFSQQKQDLTTIPKQTDADSDCKYGDHHSITIISLCPLLKACCRQTFV